MIRFNTEILKKILKENRSRKINLSQEWKQCTNISDMKSYTSLRVGHKCDPKLPSIQIEEAKKKKCSGRHLRAGGCPGKSFHNISGVGVS